MIETVAAVCEGNPTMITKWKVSNFKSIRDEVELDLGKLTVLSGVNSVGKSTLIQSILLVAQTLRDESHEQSIALNGNLVNLDRFSKLRSDGGKSNEVKIAFTCKPSTKKITTKDEILRNPYNDYPTGSNVVYLEEVDCEISFNAGKSRSTNHQLQQWPQIGSTSLSGKFSTKKKTNFRDFFMSISRNENANKKVKRDLTKTDVSGDIIDLLSYDIEVDAYSLNIITDRHHSANLFGCRLRHFMPHQILVAVDLFEEAAQGVFYELQSNASEPTPPSYPWEMVTENSKEVMNTIRNILKNVKGIDAMTLQYFDPYEWKEFIKSLPNKKQKEIQKIFCKSDTLLDQIRASIKSSFPKDWNNYGFAYTPLPQRVAVTCSYVNRLFNTSLGYIGPLRDAPKSLYPPSKNSDPFDLGYRGEETARILELNKNRVIKYMPSSSFKDGGIKRGIVSGTLQNAVNDWLQYLGIAESIESRVQETPGHELEVESSNSKRMHNLTQVGIGVSQVLPILVMGLLSREESLLIFEQPEVHLHPKSQVLLGDFFLSMALSNRQCIVESHSEHLVNRLRYRIASSPAGEELNDLTKIFFVEKTSKGSSFREVTVNEFGAIVDWPDGFFDQSYNQAQSILLAAAAKRDTNRKKNNGRPS